MRESAIHRRLSYALEVILAAQVMVALWAQQWLTAIFTLGIILITMVPLLLARRLHVYIPPQFQLLTIAIVFAALFLGEVHDYYARFWWWDSALHAVTGVLMGIIGFLLIYVLCKTDQMPPPAKASTVAFFAFTFAVTAGVLWEIGEFIIDRLLDTRLQKPMLGDPSGLTDTMVDLIIDTLGAASICIYGYFHLRRATSSSFLERWISSFIDNNPRLLQRGRAKRDRH